MVFPTPHKVYSYHPASLHLPHIVITLSPRTQPLLPRTEFPKLSSRPPHPIQLTKPSQHFQKLRRASTTGANGSVPSTPKTPKTPRTPGSRKPKQFDNNVDDDEVEEFATPSKKRKRDVIKADQENDVKEIDGIGFGGQTAAQFKMESLSSEEDFVDLEDE